MDVRTRHRTVGQRLRVFAGLAVTAFAVTLAVVIGNRLSDEALAVLAGAVCGVGAAIPTSLLIVAVSRQREGPQAHPTTPMSSAGGPYPPVVVVTPSGGQRVSDAWNTLPSVLGEPQQRHFTVVGGTLSEGEAVAYDH